MKKLLTVTCLAGLLSIPSVVFAEASWYGSIRAGVTSSKGTEGVGSFGSRWGIKGSSEVSEGLTAVYRFEDAMNATNATSGGGRLSYVGLSGGFGTITIGQIWSATYNNFGAITDNSTAFGSSETPLRHGNAVSYAVSVGNVSLQTDVLMNKGGGLSETIETDPPADKNESEDKGADSYEFGVSVGGIMETGKIALAHKRHDMNKFQKKSSSYIAGEYGIGAMTVYLGAAQHKSEDDRACMGITTKGTDAKTTIKITKVDTVETVTTETTPATAAELGKVNAKCVGSKQTDKTTFAGVRGSVGDTGVSYLFQVRSKKTKGNDADIDGDSTNSAVTTTANVLGNTYKKPANNAMLTADNAIDPDGASLDTNKTTPWMIGLSKSLGGGASVNFEYADDDIDGGKGKSALWLTVDF